MEYRGSRLDHVPGSAVDYVTNHEHSKRVYIDYGIIQALGPVQNAI